VSSDQIEQVGSWTTNHRDEALDENPTWGECLRGMFGRVLGKAATRNSCISVSR
jgi:hypothetical protein